VLRSDLSGNPSFKDLLRRVRETALAAYSHQELPFDKLVASLRPERSLGYTPLFQVLFVLQNAPASTIEVSNLTIVPLEIKTTSSKFDLGLFLRETQQGLQAVWRYSTDLFEAGSIARMASSFRHVLENIVADTEVKVSAIEMFSDEDKRLEEVRKEEEKNAKIDMLYRVQREIVDLSDTPVKDREDAVTLAGL
jgi:non-ribosomal peptide synthetase component F